MPRANLGGNSFGDRIQMNVEMAKCGPSHQRENMAQENSTWPGDKWPISDSSSERVHERLPRQMDTIARRRWSLSTGRQSSILAVSIRIPRNVTDV